MLNIREMIVDFDSFLQKKKLTFEAVVIGGAALNLLGVVSRLTRDCDILDPDIPPEILKASEEFAQHQIQSGNKIITKKWLNNGPSSLRDHLPSGWQSRLQMLFHGSAITFHCLGRPDLLKTKLYALCDRQEDRPDCIALKPTSEELREAKAWVVQQDGNPNWSKHVDDVFEDLSKGLGHGV